MSLEFHIAGLFSIPAEKYKRKSRPLLASRGNYELKRSLEEFCVRFDFAFLPSVIG